ncbi:skin secretory protein xP2-like isoform X1 [Canis lupus familiaris]|uniref:skin secretory protein xP2-like isoform X1 n=1 Tax=Canis lupus familiaris TaxID=9615 RepID=UPI0015F128E1|nr:skin secretory protein xP2-like isoform X1 [Canis lupus familiaris]
MQAVRAQLPRPFSCCPACSGAVCFSSRLPTSLAAPPRGQDPDTAEPGAAEPGARSDGGAVCADSMAWRPKSRGALSVWPPPPAWGPGGCGLRSVGPRSLAGGGQGGSRAQRGRSRAAGRWEARPLRWLEGQHRTARGSSPLTPRGAPAGFTPRLRHGTPWAARSLVAGETPAPLRTPGRPLRAAATPAWPSPELRRPSPAAWVMTGGRPRSDPGSAPALVTPPCCSSGHRAAPPVSLYPSPEPREAAEQSQRVCVLAQQRNPQTRGISARTGHGADLAPAASSQPRGGDLPRCTCPGQESTPGRGHGLLGLRGDCPAGGRSRLAQGGEHGAERQRESAWVPQACGEGGSPCRRQDTRHSPWPVVAKADQTRGAWVAQAGKRLPSRGPGIKPCVGLPAHWGACSSLPLVASLTPCVSQIYNKNLLRKPPPPPASKSFSPDVQRGSEESRMGGGPRGAGDCPAV